MNSIGVLRLIVPAILGITAAPALAETATLGNILDVPVTYQTGVPDQTGAVAWQTYTIQPCETHEWTWDQGGEPNLHWLTPLWKDQRKDEYGNIIMSRSIMPMTDQGGLIVYFPYGDQIWLDMSGAATMDACKTAAAPPPQPTVGGPNVTPAPSTDVASTSTGNPTMDELLSGPPSIFGLTYVELVSPEGQARALDDIDELFERAERGEILLIDLERINGEMVPTQIVPFDTEQVVQKLILAMLLDGTYTQERFKDELASYMIQSQALVARLRSNRDALVGGIKN